jgi:hypothetical protein
MGKKLTDLTALTTPIKTDIMYVVDDPDGTPLPRKLTLQRLFLVIDDLFASPATVDDTTDTIPIYDVSTTLPKKMTIAKLYAGVTATTSPSLSASLGQDVAFVLACQSYG